MLQRLTIQTLLCGLLGLGVTGAAAQDAALEAQNKLLARRAAEADCYRKLAETVYGLQLNAQTYVRDFVTESDVISAEVDTFVKGIRLGEPRYWPDGTCEVRGEVTVAKVITHLKEIHTRHYRGNRITGTDFERIRQHVQKDIVEATGMGAPRPELPPGLPTGVIDVLPAAPPDLPPVLPAIWQTVPVQERLMATRAAEIDAKRRLLERIMGLRLNATTLVRDFVTEYDEIQTQASGLVVGSRQVGRPYYHDNELIVEVTVEVPTEQVITTVKELHTRHYRGNRVSGTDITNVRKEIRRKTFEATGSGCPRPTTIQSVAASTNSPMPDWIAQVIRATGSGTDPDLASPQGKLKAARAAELDAKRRLAEQIHGLRINADTLVRDFVTEYDEIQTQVNSVLVGAVVEQTVWGTDVAEVTVSLPARDVWRVIHSHMVIVERRQ